MLSPNLAVVPLTRRSGAMAPLKAYIAVLVAAPDCITAPAAGSISYHRTSLRPAALWTVCWVHTAATEPFAGSRADTAWVSRPSRVSSRKVVPRCTAGGGNAYWGTGTETALAATSGAPFGFSVTESTDSSVAGPPVTSRAATTHPCEEGS